MTLGIRIKKLLDQETSGQAKPSEKEVKEFYDKNRDKFKIPESVHVRHILVASGKEDTDAMKAEKKEKIEQIRKALLGGADFGQLAKEKSDCPSRERGGDLGVFIKGQMTKKFEEAAFKQKKGEIGPIVETEFGWHIIQVLEHTPERTQELTGEVKASISDYLEKQKKYAALHALLRKLKEKATIAIAEGI
ncbi:MAG: peptidyl-prolyl cis-trans isomerase [Syntrophales bacterium]|nr:peptidyl-prolyl cis-trans isomerase [Syntrophales bacterium]